jgi:hypothetical protein
MLSIRETWEALVTETARLRLFKQVTAYPFNRIHNARFLQDLPALTPPACLVVFLGRRTEVMGGGRYHECRFSLVVCVRDAAGKGWQESCDLVDKLELKLLDRQLLADELTIMGSNDVGVAPTGPDWSILELALNTREGAQR